VLTAADSPFAIVNVNILDCAEEFSQARGVSYEGESEAERIRRRQQNWTPASVIIAEATEAQT
jgi:hypothetical protein